MNSPQSQQIIARFFAALDDLKIRKVIWGKATFAKKYGINNRNFWFVEHNPASDSFQMAWLAALVSDYNVSAHWLLTGQGVMYTKTPTTQRTRQPREPYKHKQKE